MIFDFAIVLQQQQNRNINFGKFLKGGGGGGGHSKSKKKRCNFFCIINGTFGHEFSEKLQNRGGGVHFRSEIFCCKFSANATGTS